MAANSTVAVAVPPTLSKPAPRAADAAGKRGALALIGGRFEPDNQALYAALRSHSDGRIAVLSMASGYPEEVGEETVDEFRDQGFYAELVPIFHETRNASPFDPALIERLHAFGSVFFTGGDQSRIVSTLVQGGTETPALTAVRELHRRGGLIAGSSAGAAVMSGPMILGGTSLHAVAQGIDDRPGAADDVDRFRLGTGLGFFTAGMVDQHFLARGRIGRLICAARATGNALAFGIDENSAMIVCGERADVVGETGVVFVDLRKARFDAADRFARDIRISYLDDGDGIDLRRGKPLPAADKKRTRVTRASYTSRAPVRRNAFAGYGLHDLMLRLVEADPGSYRQDSADAFDPITGTEVTLTLTRKPRKSRALRAVRNGEIRYSALDFQLDIDRVQLDACPLPQSNQVLRPDPAETSRLVLLGDAPMGWSDTAQTALRRHLLEPVGILATASGEPAAMADRYIDWLNRAGLRCEVLPIGLHNIERASRDRSLLRSIDRMGSLLLTGGDQRRLTEALLHCADATPVLHSLVTAYERGTPVIAVAAAASALGERMIAEGDSVAAFRYGSTEDAGGSGVIVERGIGLSDIGLFDQHFSRRHRLGRLLMACAEQHLPFGFGLCEGAGMVIHGDGAEIEAIGNPGVVVAELDLKRVALAPDNPDPTGIRLHILEAGRRVALGQLTRERGRQSEAATQLLETAITQLARDYSVAQTTTQSARERFNGARWQELLVEARRAAG